MKTIQFDEYSCDADLQMTIGNCKNIPHEFSTGELHNTDFYEVIIFNKGKGTLQIDQSQIELKDQLIVFISPFQKRQWFVKDGDIDALFLIFQEDFLNDYFSDKIFTYRLQYFHQLQNPVAMLASDLLFDRVKVVFEEIIGEVQNFRCDSGHLIRSLLYFLLIRLNRDYALNYGLGTESHINNHAYQFKQLLEQHIKKKQRIEDYVELMGVSRITLNKAVKKQYKVTASQLIKQRLLAEIKNLLVFSKMSISDISFELSFSEPNHLIRFFKRLTGQTPAQYRVDYQNGML